MTVTELGLLAGAITSLAGVPQVMRAWRTKSVEDIYIWQPVLLTVGMSLWLLYGVLIGDLPLMAANAFSLVCYILLIILKVRYGYRGDNDFTDALKKEEP
jgi:MtN3 and saliva related transmembrane protein